MRYDDGDYEPTVKRRFVKLLKEDKSAAKRVRPAPNAKATASAAPSHGSLRTSSGRLAAADAPGAVGAAGAADEASTSARSPGDARSRADPYAAHHSTDDGDDQFVLFGMADMDLFPDGELIDELDGVQGGR